MIVGTFTGNTPFNVTSNTRYLVRFTGEDRRLLKVSVDCDGQGPGVGAQVAKGCVYAASGALLAVGTEITIADGQARGVVDFPFEVPGGVELPDGDCYMGIHAGAISQTMRIYGLS